MLDRLRTEMIRLHCTDDVLNYVIRLKELHLVLFDLISLLGTEGTKCFI